MDCLERKLLDPSEEPDLDWSLLKTITNNFSDDAKIGSGGFADVYKCNFVTVGSTSEWGNHRCEEAVQRYDMDDKKFIIEVGCLMKAKHKNIVRFLGYCSGTKGEIMSYEGKIIHAEKRHRLLCFEYLPKGSLDKYITDVSRGLEWRTRYEIIKGICEGVHYLHENSIVHLDLKPANILLNDDMVPKIADFGISRWFDEKQTRAATSNVYGTLGYMAPEFYNKEITITFKSDIYSLGNIILEMLTGRKGYPDDINNVLTNWSTRFGNIPGDPWLEHVKQCVEMGIKCIDHNPGKRPTTRLIMEMLADMERKCGFDETHFYTSLEAHDNDDSVNSLDDLLYDVTAEPIHLPFTLLQGITQNFADERKIGQGGYGIVYKGVLRTGSVAIKKLLNSQTIADEPFLREVTILMRVRHKNIVRFLGYCANTECEVIKIEGSESLKNYIFPEIRERLLCFDYMSNGGLDRHLTDELRGLEWDTRYQIIKGICDGLQYLHKKNIVHMDLKPANILLDDNMVPKITDFGISRYLDGVSRYVTKQSFVMLGYCAPEYLLRGEVSLKADIYSLGVIIRDIVTGRKQDIDSKNVLRRWRYRWNRSGIYPPLGFQQISKCIEIAQSCMVENPKLRPYIWDITNAVESMAGQISPYSWELLEIDPLQLIFSFELNKEIQCSFELNNDRDDYIAFQIQKPNILNYFVEPNKGIMPPHSKSTVTVKLQASNRAPDSMLCKENFVVRCAIVDDGLTAPNVNEDVFDTKLGKVVDEVMLTVAFT